MRGRGLTVSKRRSSREFWAVDNEGLDVKRVVGWECLGYDWKVWWVPSLGYSLTIGYQLFENENDARARAVELWVKQLRRYADAVKAQEAAGFQQAGVWLAGFINEVQPEREK